MGKKLIIKDVDFSTNAVFSESGSVTPQPQPQSTFIPQAVTNVEAKTFFANLIFDLKDDVNEFSGKTITGFDLLFKNKCKGRTMGIDITFNPNTEQKIVCNIVCNFETQNESEEKIIHYNLSKPYTFKNNDIIQIAPTNTIFIDSNSQQRGGCVVFRVTRPNNIPNFAFVIKSLPNYSFQPFMKLYCKSKTR